MISSVLMKSLFQSEVRVRRSSLQLREVAALPVLRVISAQLEGFSVSSGRQDQEFQTIWSSIFSQEWTENRRTSDHSFWSLQPLLSLVKLQDFELFHRGERHLGAETKATYQCSGEGKKVCGKKLLDPAIWPRPPGQSGKVHQRRVESKGLILSLICCSLSETTTTTSPLKWRLPRVPRRTWESSVPNLLPHLHATMQDFKKDARIKMFFSDWN